MLDDLDRSLEALLNRELSGDHPRLAVVFDAPSAATAKAASAAQLRVFLYDVRENRELRSLEPRLDRRSTPPVQHAPPLLVDCSYGLTACSSDGALVEHRLLGDAFRVLSQFPVLPADVLQGRLRGADVDPVRLRGGPTGAVRRLWAASGASPRPLLRYTVTLALPPAPPEPVTLVQTHVVRTVVREAAPGLEE